MEKVVHHMLTSLKSDEGVKVGSHFTLHDLNAIPVVMAGGFVNGFNWECSGACWIAASTESLTLSSCAVYVMRCQGQWVLLGILRCLLGRCFH